MKILPTILCAALAVLVIPEVFASGSTSPTTNSSELMAAFKNPKFGLSISTLCMILAMISMWKGARVLALLFSLGTVLITAVTEVIVDVSAEIPVSVTFLFLAFITSIITVCFCVRHMGMSTKSKKYFYIFGIAHLLFILLTWVAL